MPQPNRNPAAQQLAPARVRDCGVTFIEILVSIVLLGTAGLAVIAGIAATIRSVSTHDHLATVQARVADAGDVLTDITVVGDNYVAGALVNDYQPLVDTHQVTVEEVWHWNASLGTWEASPTGADTIPMQRITLSATVDGLTRELIVVKRKATEASSPGGAWNDAMVTPDENPGFP